jgi:hypothetical protein
VPADLWRLHIEIAKVDVEKLRAYQWNGWRGAPQERPEVLATVREGGVVYTNVALHLKGAAGSFRHFDDKPALTLSFSKHAPGQRFHGYSKISLNNSVQDPSYLCEAISRELFEAAGVPVPRADHATVILNGRDLNLYVLTEGFGKPFLSRYFKNAKGNLYDSGFLQDLHPHLDTNSGDNPEDRSDLRRLIDAAMDPNATHRWQCLNRVLDMDRFLSFLALEIMTCHWDGYGMNRNNYRLFHDLETDRMVFIPHGLDQMFGVRRMPVDSPIEPPMQGLVAQAVLMTPPGRRLLLERIASLRTNVLLEAKLTNRVHELSRRIRPTLAAYNPAWAADHDGEVASLCQRIVERARSISEQLASPIEPIEFDRAGIARPSGWSQYVPERYRHVLLLDRSETDGRRLLHIAATQGGGGASWRTRAILEAGRYRFEGQVRILGIRGGGVRLFASGAQTGLPQLVEEEWSLFRVNLTVHEPIKEVELICELRAASGQAWFDEESLQLVRE